MISDKMKRIRDILLSVTEDVFHYEALKKPDKYIVWAEDLEGNSLHTDNKKKIPVIQGSVDYFTKQEFDSKVDEIQKALSDAGISFYLNSSQYEEETGYIHYDWIFEVS